jgi:NarL family two-component system response regulator LiaR
MLVDDHKVVRSGLAAFLLAHNEFELVAEADDGLAAIRLCASARPDVILMDLLMPRMDGVTATRAILARFPEIRILILTNFKEENLIGDALKVGALGYLLKNITPDELANAIHAASRGRGTLAPEVVDVLIHATWNQGAAPLGHDLTGREREVLDFMAKGLDNRSIAESLIVSSSTVKFHVSRSYLKNGWIWFNPAKGEKPWTSRTNNGQQCKRIYLNGQVIVDDRGKMTEPFSTASCG